MTRVLLAGATGLVGSQVLQHLSLLGSKIDLHIVSRRPLVSLPSGVQAHIADIATWPIYVAEIAPNIVISCLGTTIKTSGSKAAFSAVDLDLVTSFAKSAKAAGAAHMIAISSVGANANSPNFYLSTKGKAEAALRALEFERLDILRPGLLRGNRQENRTGEALGIMLSPLTDALLYGPLRRYRSINSFDVAMAIANLVKCGGQGEFIHENDSITALAG